MTKKNNDDNNLSFEEALVRLEALVGKLEEGNLPLEESLELFADGITLTKLCTKHLDEAEKRIGILTENEDGTFFIREEDL